MILASTVPHQRRLLLASIRRFSWAASSTGMSWTPADAQLRSDKIQQSLRAMSMAEDEMRFDTIYSASLGLDESMGESTWRHTIMADARMESQMTNSQNQLQCDLSRIHVDTAPLPQTLEDALRHSRRAIVITEAQSPFRIVTVNAAWEELCGYSYGESKGQTLGSLLQGPLTNQLCATQLVSKVLEGEEAGAVLTNYTKEGRVFQNRVRVGPIYDGDGISHFVGVLQEVAR